MGSKFPGAPPLEIPGRANFSRLNGSMSAFFRSIRHFRSACTLIALAALLTAAALPLLGQYTHLWTQSRLGEFEEGTPQGVAIGSDGFLRAGPGLTHLLTTPSTFVWSVAVDKNGVAYLGTGSPGTVLRLAPGAGSKPFTLFKTKDVSVQAVRVGPDGWIYAATLPSGRVYRLKADAAATQDDSSATVVFDAATAAEANAGAANAEPAKTGSTPHYIWALTFDTSGRLYIATGNPGAIYRVNPAQPGAKPELFFKSDDAHIRSLAWDAKGNLIAGSDGTGLVYRIDPQGKGYVLFEAPRREITSLAVGKDGTIYAACVGEKNRNPLPPLPVQGVGTVTVTIVQPESVQAVNASSSVPEGSEIYALAAGQAPRKLWSDAHAIVYALASRPDGLLAVSGNQGRIFLIRQDGGYADIGHLDAQQGLSMAAEPGSESGILIGAGNTGKLFRLGATKKHEYGSDVLDTGVMSQFGRVEVEPGSSGYEILTRTGNVEQPVRGWTDWQPLKDGVVASAPGRFLQWKAVLETGGVVGSVGVNYLPVSSPPVVDNLVVVPGARLTPQSVPSPSQTVNISFGSASDSSSGSSDDSSSSTPLQAAKDPAAITVRWAAHDPDGGNLIYSLYLRGDGETVWQLIKDRITATAYSFDAAKIPDGGYRIKVVASNSPSEPAGGALTGDKISDRFVVDTTPPALSGLKATGEPVQCENGHCRKPFLISFEAVDATSPIASADYSLNLGPWQYIDPAGKISDSKTERYEFRIWLDVNAGKVGESAITVRAYDRYGNVGRAKMFIPAQNE